MDLSPTRTVVTYDDVPWVGSKHGTDCDESGTLDVAAFRTADLVDANGFIASGIPVVRDDVSKLYEPAPALAPCDGHIAEQVKVNPGSTHAGFALRWHGVVIVAQLPGDYADDFAPATDGAPAIRYRDA